MADFPSLTPTIRPLTPGRWGGATLASMSGQTSTVRRSSAEIGRRVSLRFENITEAQFLDIVNHYRGQRSGLDGFNFNSATIPASYTPSGHTWLYAGPPQVVDRHQDVFTVEMECRSEPRGPFRVSGVAFTTLPALTAGTPTAIIPGLAITPVESLTAGTITPIVAGAALAPPGNPGDPDCSLLLSFSGANDSTGFVDSSGKGLTTSHVVGAKISTAQSKFGGSSGLFAPTSYIRYTPQAGLQMTGDFTIEAQLYPLSTADMMAASSSSDSNTQIFRLNESGSGRLSFYLNGTQVFSSTAAGITANTWQHVSICRSGSSTRMFVNGTQVGSTNTTWTGSFRIDVIGAYFLNGSLYGSTHFNGHIDELIVLKRATRTANFTAPASPYDGATSASFTPGSATGIVAGAGYSSISPSLAPGAPV